MSLKDLPTTVVWIYTETVLWSILCISVSIIMFMELKSVYNEYRSKVESDLTEMQQASEVKSNTDTSTISVSRSRSRSGSPSSNKSEKEKEKKVKLVILNVSMYSSYIMSGIIAICFKFGIGIFNGCNPCGIQGIFYTTGKMLLYLAWIYRLYSIYKHSIFQYKTGILIIVAVISVLFNCMITIINLFTIKSTSINIDGHIYCQCILTLKILAALVLLFDFVVSVLCCYFFIRPIKKMHLLDENKRDHQVLSMVIRFTTLTFVAVISTFLILLLIMVTKLNGLMSIDAIINCFCIFFFNAKFKGCYQNICCGAAKCANKIVEKCCIKK